jgi:hypothetical protein
MGAQTPDRGIIRQRGKRLPEWISHRTRRAIS